MTEKQTTVEKKVKTLKNGRRAFTLVELITVIAITGVLLSIIIVPLFQGFNFTRTAQAYGDAQDRARVLVDRLTTEIGSASLVRDPNGVGGMVNIEVPVPAQGKAPDGSRVTPTNAGAIVAVGLPFAKLDIVLPAKEGRVAGAPNVFIDPVTGKVDPTLSAPKGQITLPMAPGQTIRRYWIGRRDPFQEYINPYDGLLARASGRDNLYVLYTAEVQPYIPVATGTGTVMSTNPRFFDVDPRTVNGPASQPLLDDPNFFLPDRDGAGNIIANNAKATRIRNWIRRATILTEVSRYDMVLPAYERSTRLVNLDPIEGLPGQFTPRMVPLLQLKPSRVSNDPATGQTASRLGEESDNGVDLGPEVFRGQYGQWSNLRVRIYPSGFATGNFYVVGRRRAAQLTPGNYPSSNLNDFSVFLMDPVDNLPDTDDAVGLEVFNSSVFTRSVAQGRRYPFSDALSAANTVSGWLSSTNTDYRDNFMPFVVNTATGAVVTGFPIGTVGNPTAAFPPVGVVNLPERPAGDAFTPTNDPAVGSGTFSDAQFASINRSFNKIWADARNGQNGVPAWLGEVGGAHRFIDLRVTPQLDGTLGPLHPTSPFGAAAGTPLRRCRIVPGSDEVFGPDQNPGPNYGTLIRYRRVTREPGPNEYRINYADLPEPDYTALGLANPPATYAAGNFVSAVVQPRFRAGYVQLCSQPEVPIPAQMTEIDQITGNTVSGPGEVRVAYRFQFTGNNDIVAVDYDTRDLISILLTIRNYPQSTVPNPQTVTLKATAAVRNFTR